MKRRSVCLALLLVVTAASCSKPKPVQLVPQSVQLSSIGPEGVGLSLQLNAHNPNGFPIYASAVNATLELRDEQELGRGSSAPAFKIPAEGDATLPADLLLRWTNLTLLTPYALAAIPKR